MVFFDWAILLKHTNKDPKKILGYIRYLTLGTEKQVEQRIKYPYIRKVELRDKKISFIVNEKDLLANKYNATDLEICAYIGLASKRRHLEYLSTGNTYIPAYYFSSKALTRMRQNRLLEIRNEKILLKYE